MRGAIRFLAHAAVVAFLVAGMGVHYAPALPAGGVEVSTVERVAVELTPQPERELADGADVLVCPSDSTACRVY